MRGDAEGPRTTCVAASTAFVMIWLRRRSAALLSPRAGGRRVSVDDNTLKVWDVATGECVATLDGNSSMALRRPLYFCDDVSSS